MSPPRPEDFLPLKPATFLVLVVLAAQELHGYGIKKEVAKRSAATGASATLFDVLGLAESHQSHVAPGH
ncbi:MAG: hypothetical protein IIA55_03925 [Gemmatimonadetes bacterium]|nr:hypothetical protein [Gemmatimonadota bacterium]